MSPIEPSATLFRRTWPFAVRLTTLFIALCAMWLAIAFLAVAIEYLTSQPSHPKAFAIVDEWLPPESTFGVVVAVILTYQFYLRAPPNIGGSARTGAWIIGAGLVVLGALSLFAVNMAPRCLTSLPGCSDLWRRQWNGRRG
jgi:hypothetical protein